MANTRSIIETSAVQNTNLAWSMVLTRVDQQRSSMLWLIRMYICAFFFMFLCLYIHVRTSHLNCIQYFCSSTVKLWDLRRTYTNCKLEPPHAWHTFTPIGDSARPYSKPFTMCLCDMYMYVSYNRHSKSVIGTMFIHIKQTCGALTDNLLFAGFTSLVSDPYQSFIFASCTDDV